MSENTPVASMEEIVMTNDPELKMLRKLKLTLSTMLHMLECARDDMVAMGERMDRLTIASEQCRTALEQKKRQSDRSSIEPHTR